MKRLNFKTILAAAAVAMSAVGAYAVPAMPGIHKMQQADGSVLNVLLAGDENYSYRTTEDGYLIMKNDGNYYFAEMEGSDMVRPSKWLATNPENRSAELNRFLSRLDREEMVQVMNSNWLDATTMSRAGAGLMPGTRFPSSGDRKILVLLVEYQDVKFNLPNPYRYFHDMLNKEGFSEYNGTGSVRDFYIASSNGKFRPQIDVYGPVTLANNMAYYGGNSIAGNDMRPREMVIEAMKQLDPDVDFSQYDTDSDGIIDNVFVYYAGQGEASGGSEDSVWPHQGNVTGYSFDGKRLLTYACTNEWKQGTPDGIGTFCHEFGHVLGLGDLYATTYPTPAPFTPGEYDTMDGGPYNNNGRTPPLYSAFERYALGWITPTEIKGEMNCTLYPLHEKNECYLIKTSSNNEYFILENRQKQGWDRFIPGHGMLVWHIDYNQSKWQGNTINNTASHQYVDIEEADNDKTEATRAGDTFPGTAGITSFTDNTTPSMKTWSGAKLNLPITEIKENAPDGRITFKVNGGAKMTATTAKAATDVTPRSFKASWNAVSGAKYYQLSVYVKDTKGNVTYAAGYDHRNVGNVTSFDVTGLNPSTGYLYSVVVSSDNATSNPSNEIAFNTLAMTHEYVIPEVLPATEVANESYVANWSPVEGATGYELEAYRWILKGATEMTESFDSKQSSWFTTSSTFNTQTLYAKTGPSLKMSADDYISSPMTSGDVRSFSFWHRGQKTDAESRIVVEAYVADCWTPVVVMPIVTASKGTTTEIFNFPAGTKAVRVVAQGLPSTGYLYLDNMGIVSGGTLSTRNVPGFAPKPLGGDVTSFLVEGVDPGSDNFYTVVAIKGNSRSMKSAPMRLKTKGTDPEVDGIEGVFGDAAGAFVSAENGVINISAAAGEMIMVSDTNGRLIYSGTAGMAPTEVYASAGIYVVRAGAKAIKVIVK